MLTKAKFEFYALFVLQFGWVGAMPESHDKKTSGELIKEKKKKF